MIDPMLDEEDRALEEGLLRAGRNVGMSPELRNRTLVALGIGGSVVGAAATAKAGTFAGLSGKAAAVLGAGVAALVAVGVIVTQPKEAPAPSDAARSPGAALPASAAEASAAERAPESPELVTEASKVEVGQLPSAENAAPQGANVQRRPAGDKKDPSGGASLRDELTQISRVEAALKRGQAGQALTLLKEYHALFPRPRLGLEAEVLTIQALFESGSVAAARARAQAFLERYPKSPLGARARQYLK